MYKHVEKLGNNCRGTQAFSWTCVTEAPRDQRWIERLGDQKGKLQ